MFCSCGPFTAAIRVTALVFVIFGLYLRVLYIRYVNHEKREILEMLHMLYGLNADTDCIAVKLPKFLVPKTHPCQTTSLNEYAHLTSQCIWLQSTNRDTDRRKELAVISPSECEYPAKLYQISNMLFMQFALHMRALNDVKGKQLQHNLLKQGKVLFPLLTGALSSFTWPWCLFCDSLCGFGLFHFRHSSGTRFLSKIFLA